MLPTPPRPLKVPYVAGGQAGYPRRHDDSLLAKGVASPERCGPCTEKIVTSSLYVLRRDYFFKLSTSITIKID